MSAWHSPTPERVCHACGCETLPTHDHPMHMTLPRIPKVAVICWSCYRQSSALGVILGQDGPAQKRHVLEATSLIISLLHRSGTPLGGVSS